jgi:Na+-translocating ferredoxin:NAD+ oxidoreductase RnfD subunit
MKTLKQDRVQMDVLGFTRFLPPLLITGVLAGYQMSYGILEGLGMTLVAITSAVLAEVFLGRFSDEREPNLVSGYITGISVGILIRSLYLWPYVVCSLTSIFSKYVLRWRGRHLWNPSNLGVSVMLFTAPETVAGLSIQWGNDLWVLLPIWGLGLLTVWRVNRLHICLTYVASFLAFAWVRGLITGQALLPIVSPLTGPMYQLFIFFMITDPRTTVRSRKGQCVVVFLVAFVEMFLRLEESIYAPFYALCLVGPAGNAFEIWYEGRRKVQRQND